jgi:GAF domain-containing protein
MIPSMAASSNDIYEAVVALSRSLAGRADLRSLLEGVAESLRRIVNFDYLGLVLHEADTYAMQGYILHEPGNPVIRDLRLPVDQDPAGWVWLNQRPLVVAPLADETRWPEFVQRARAVGISTVVLIPLTAGDNRLGAFGFGSVAPFQPGPAELAFLERVASEFAVAVDAFLAKQKALHERDRLRTLFDITNALVSRTMAQAVNKIVVLTGTLLGGYADDVFNVLYRLVPHKMIAEGYEWGESGVRSFSEVYGVLERVTIIPPQENACSKAKIVKQIKRKPGASPLLFGKFLMELGGFVSL